MEIFHRIDFSAAKVQRKNELAKWADYLQFTRICIFQKYFYVDFSIASGRNIDAN